ncbi:hypothetical protein [Streptomyces reniochalinae]|uniref:hypothetical protein n=1 Tax=Streptomyces reniochalinae TaxID=2250578 RepID=UPI0015F0E562|nr:hypothetical protein [Streptomyces reniochalinae]
MSSSARSAGRAARAPGYAAPATGHPAPATGHPASVAAHPTPVAEHPTAAGHVQRAAERHPWRRDERWWLAGVCGAFGLLSLTLVHPGLPLGWDELVYASRFSPHGPETPFSAPRTRGVPALIAPVAAFSDSVVLLRCYLTLTAALSLFLGYLPWVGRFSRRGTVPLAAALYGSVWIALFYAGAAMPNHYVATGLVAAVGCFLRSPATGRTRAGAAAALALAALMRPNDAVWPALVLLAAALGARRLPLRARTRTALAVTCGLAAGLLPWAVEASLRFGGVLRRVRAASEVQGGMSPRLTLDALKAHAAALDGPLLCRPCDGATLEWSNAGWWLLIPPLLLLGLRAARQQGRTASAALPLTAAAAVALPYLLFMEYAAPRFLLPAYALLAPVAALGALRAARWARARGTRRARVCVPLGGGALAALHLALQLQQLGIHSGIQTAVRHDWQRVEEVLRAHGVRPPCVLGGNSSTVPVAHTAGCHPARAGTPDALVLREAPLPAWAAAADWHLHPVPRTYNPGWRVAFPPRADTLHGPMGLTRPTGPSWPTSPTRPRARAGGVGDS